ncbi:uncharacterized protein TRAVEDRAFT_108798 [Trametes versicolor FP-101664 SS1]|uniref:uncharacterized protein n=1 Tax=Trametes versicolor (strain FP-101664) TaxID=717944 RepID=UPI000462315C|nr:uncharacterized protein TRAVEDRAFT_108798 [Trametes versicolor FP-101664 SS1]EIW64956.1 hypothetical protein TRAVEDRAFT_108798 [Trametes versicolor FP-101664 SS1]
MTKQKFYAVHNGRGGTQIYTTWEEVSRFSGAIHKSFRSLPEARAWLLGFFHDAMDVDTTLVNTQPPPAKSQQDAVMPDATPAPAVPAPAPPPAQEIQLSPDQQRVLDMVKRGESVFFTGSAGMYLSHSHRHVIHRGYRNGKVSSPARNHQAAWWSPKHQACCDCLDWYCFSQYRRMYPPLVGWYRSREGRQGCSCRQDPWYIYEGIQNGQEETGRVAKEAQTGSPVD